MSQDTFFSILPGLFIQPRRTWQTISKRPISVIRFFLVFGLPFIVLGSLGRAFNDQNSEAFVELPLFLLFLSHFSANLLVLLLGSWMVNRLSGSYGKIPGYGVSLKLSVVSYLPFLLAQFIAALAPVIDYIAYAGMIYALVLFWLGAPILLDTPKSRLTGFTLLAFFVFLGLSLLGFYLFRLIIFADSIPS